ncbi:FG-GAP repeat domain-containing protein [Myxacorys almedinensis]|uniref:Uncharacterized protein n=1 Tax=Myxacorys almedinensis A TaxID=2690445 RepID=A0A8J8CLR2_9CYAN|nr:VCBS repeat-containing protein [Myxacorys almedinensis]NDJ19956.1 hypothetical protein [Myxacorys almedinensis A]
MPTNEQFDAAISLNNPFSLQTETGVLGSKDDIKLYKVSASSSSLNARLSLTDLSGNALLRVYDNDRMLVQGGASNQPSRLSESILLNNLASGTYYIEVALDPDPAVTSASYKLNVEFNTTADFSNIFWRNNSLEQYAIWQMAGNTVLNGDVVSGLDAGWQAQGFADFNGDGEDDIVWRNLNSGEVAFSFLKDKQIIGSGSIQGVPLDWNISYTANLNGDKFADLVWQKPSTGEASMWLMQGATRLSAEIIPSAPDWSIRHVGDLNGDNRDDMIWRSTSGTTSFVLMEGTAIAEQGAAIAVPPAWKIEFLADLDGDGTEDIVWRNEQTGVVSLWLMDGIQRTAFQEISAGLGWRVEQVGDFNGDGKADLLWRSVSNDVVVTLMDGLTTITNASLQPVGQEWKVEQVSDFNGDGKDDLLWRSESAQSVSIWLMDGTANTVERLKSNGVVANQEYGGIDAGWKIQGILHRTLTSQPFSISDATLETAFNIGTLDDTGVYQDNIQVGEDDFYRFSVGVETDLTAAIAGGDLELYKSVAGVWELQTYQAGVKETIGTGEYYVRVSGTNTVAQPYTLTITGIPRRINLLGTAFALGQSSIALDDSDAANNSVNATFQIKNLEAFVAQDFKVSFYISRDSEINPFDMTGISGDQQLEIELVGISSEEGELSGNDLLVKKLLGKNGTFDGTVKLTLPNVVGDVDGFWTIDKPYYIGMAINVSGLQNETDQGNNFNVEFGKDKFELGVSEIPTTDLTGKSLTGATSTDTFAPGELVPLTYVIENLGSKPASTSFRVNFYASLDADINPDEDFLVDSRIINSTIGRQTTSAALMAEAILPTKNTWSALENLFGRTEIYLGMFVNSVTTDLSEPERDNNLNQAFFDPNNPANRFDKLLTYIDLGSEI